MTAEVLYSKFKNMQNPNEIFDIYEDGSQMPAKERDKLIAMGIGDAINMQYITALEMKRKGTWEAYMKKWEENRGKTWEDNLREYMKERGLSFPRNQ